jgi:hypothetical protein
MVSKACGGLQASPSSGVAAGSTPPPPRGTQRGFYSCSEQVSLASWAPPPSSPLHWLPSWSRPIQRPVCPWPVSLASEDPVHRGLESSERPWVRCVVCGKALCPGGDGEGSGRNKRLQDDKLGCESGSSFAPSSCITFHQFGPQFLPLYNGDCDNDMPNLPSYWKAQGGHETWCAI